MSEIVLITNFLDASTAKEAGFTCTADLGAGLFELRAECEAVDTDGEVSWVHVAGEPFALRAEWDRNHHHQDVYAFPADEFFLDIENYMDAHKPPAEFVEPDFEPGQGQAYRALAAKLRTKKPAKKGKRK